MTNRRDEERDRRGEDAERRRREDERRSDELKEAWRRNHPSKPDGGDDRMRRKNRT